jgi:flavin-dependent dehydrogenase
MHRFRTRSRHRERCTTATSRGSKGRTGIRTDEFSLGDDELVYVFPSDGGLACVALSLNLDDYRGVRTDSERAFQDRVAGHPFVAGRVEKAAWSGRLWACGPRPSMVKVPTGPGWALVGDASMYQDPWTGLGMDNAAMHATFLAEAVGDVLSGTDESVAWADFHRRRDEHAISGFMDQPISRAT